MPTPAAPGALTLAFSPAVVRRALWYAVVVGAILIAINHGSTILAGDVPADRLVRMALTVLVPYVVSTLSSVQALRGASRVPPPAGPGGPSRSR